MSVAQKRERVLPRLIEEEMREAFLDYSMSVIVQRALPDVRDGLKPVHRRILYAMRELGLLPDRPHKKSATVVGEVLGKYHPHGDTAVYDTLVRMVQDFSLRYPLIDGQGNFGSIDGDAAAAYRYTEARLAAISLELLDDLDKETVDWSPNFDDRLLEPSVLPARLPNLLVNGSAGIAVGMSTNIPPHNLTEVTGAFRVLAANPDCTLDDLMEHVPGPDFPTGGFILGTDGIRDMYATGRGRLIVRGRLRKEALRGGRSQLVVTELPYGVSKVRVIEQIVDLSKKGRLEDVSDVRDESDRDGMRLVIELKRGASAPKTIQTLYKRTHLQGTFGAIVLALDNGEPKELTLKQMLERYRDHRLEVVVRRSRFDLEKAEAELHIVQGLLLALDQIDEVIRIIKDSEDRAEAHERLLDTFGLSELQADAILNMRLARLTALEGDQLRDRSAALAIDIANLRGLLGSEEEQLAVVVAELEAADERFGDDRRTQIVEEGEPEEEATEQVMADEDVVVTVSHQGFLKRMPVHLYRRRVNAGKALAGMESYEDDWLSRVFTARTQGWLLAFTEGGHAHFLSVLDVPESSRASRGQAIYALTGADREDPIVALLPVEDLADEAAYLVFVTRGGIVKRTALSEFSNPRAGGIIASGVKKGDGIIDVAVSDGRADVVLMTRGGRAIRFREKDVPVVGRPAQGVKGVGLRGDDRVVSVVMVRREAAVMTIDDRGWGKRTPIGEFPLQKRGGLGTMALPADSDGGIVAALEVVAGDEVSAVTAAGIVSQLEAESIPEQGRRTRGASLLTLEGDDRVVEVARSAGGAGSGSGTGGEGGGTEDSGPDPADGEETDEVDTDPGDGVDDGEETDDGDGTDDGDETDDGDGARNGKAGQSDLFGS